MTMRAIGDCVIRTKRLFGNCEGGAAAEFALLIPFILLLIYGIYEFGRLYWIQNTLQFAAEQTGRNAYLLELDPRYCDVVVRRYETYSGGQAKRLET